VPKGSVFIPAVLLFLLNLFVYFQVRFILYKRLRERKEKSAKLKTDDKNLPAKRKGFSYYLNHGVISFETIGVRYRSFIDSILSSSYNRRRAVIAVIIFSVFSYLLLPLGFVRNEFFPKSDSDFLYISLELPAGTSLKTTDAEVLKILEDIRRTPDMLFATATLRLSIDPGRGYAGASDNTALVTVVLPDKSLRKKSSIDMAEDLRTKYQNYQKGTIAIIEDSGGPPAGSDVQIKLFGDDLGKLDDLATTIQTYLAKQPGVTNISKSVKAGTSKVVFVPDYQKMLDAGVTQDQLGLWLRTYASGFTLQSDAKLSTGSNEKQDIVFRTNTYQQKILSVDSIVFPTTNGPVALATLGKFELRPNPTLITRENGKRTISVSAGVSKGTSATETNKKLEDFAKSIDLPEGYSWSTGGANEENQNSVNSILQAMLLSFFLIVVTMVLQFSSFRKALIVMLVIPLSISGVFIVFAITNTPLSFPALIGVLALFGIVVKNSILVVDKINQNIRHNMPFREAIVDASESRLEPVALTSFAAIVGLVPITLSDPVWQGLGGAIISGLLFSGSIMLFFIPVMYYLLFQGSEGKKTVRK
jgi:HAE1 family hydrophobic/amphiphilic exporter-1